MAGPASTAAANLRVIATAASATSVPSASSAGTAEDREWRVATSLATLHPRSRVAIQHPC